MYTNHINHIACVGSGVIGTSWALSFAWRGKDVRIYDISEEQLAKSKKIMLDNLETLKSFDLINDAEGKKILDRVTYTTDLQTALDGVQFVQESGPESYEIKKNILNQIESLVADDVIIASSTSGLLITQIAEAAKCPERVIGGHPYNPPYLIPLVEIIKGKQTSDDAALAAYHFYQEVGKEPVILNKEVSGFISNRLQVAVYREMIDLVENGVCSMEDVDKALVWGPGIRWAIMGANLIFHLGAGEGGLQDMLEKQKESTDLRLSQMADWKEMPQSYIAKANERIAEEISHLPKETGRTIPELVKYRDTMLIEILKLHKKL